jgi:hypothetical protein
MLIHDDTFAWEGFGGLFNLAAGRCRLRIFDLAQSDRQKIVRLKPIIVVVSDLPDDSPKVRKITVRSCASHIATKVVHKFNIDPQRMMFVEYYPASTYGDRNQHAIPAKYEVVDFTWHGDKALHPAWRSLEEPLLSQVAECIAATEQAKP